MKQLTIYCSRDLEDRVAAVLDHAGAQGYLRLAGATANRFAPRGQVPRVSGCWEATLILVPGTEEARARLIVEALEEYAGGCEIAPCLRVMVSPLDPLS